MAARLPNGGAAPSLRVIGIVGGTRHNELVRVFISSLISDYEHYRAAATEAVHVLGHQVVRAEDFHASAETPQQACLAAVRESDLIVLLIGERYGYTQESGLSATHEEYREARDRKPVLVFVETGTTRDASQQALLEEVQAWATGHFTASYATPDELKAALLRALHDYELATTAGPIDEAEMRGRATALLPHNQGLGGTPELTVVVAGGPHQQVLRPVDLEHTDLARGIHQEAFFGEHQVLDRNESTSTGIRAGTLVLGQRVASVAVDHAGSVRIVQPAASGADGYRTALPALIEEDLAGALERAIRFSGWLLDRIDPVRRLTDVVPVARIAGGSYMAWRTRAQHSANPNAATIPYRGTDDPIVTLTPARRHRQALTHDAHRIAEDLVTLLRREMRG
jgi:hypothetical protein